MPLNKVRGLVERMRELVVHLTWDKEPTSIFREAVKKLNRDFGDVLE